MPLIRGDNITYTAGNAATTGGLVADTTHLYAPANLVPARVIKSSISPLAQVAVATLTKDGAVGIAHLSGSVFTTHAGLTISDANAGLVVKTSTATMLQTAFTQLWSPGVGSRRQSVAIHSDGSFLYVGSNAYFDGAIWVFTKTSKMDSTFGSLTEVTLPTRGSTVSPSSVDSDGTHVYFAIGRGPTPDPTDSVVKLTLSPYAYVSKWDLPSGENISDVMSVPPKLYVGTTQGKVYRIDTSSMTSDGVVITLGSGEGGAGAMLQFDGILYLVNLGNAGGTSSSLFAYNIITYERVGSVGVGASSSSPTGVAGVFGPGTQSTVQYWGMGGSIVTLGQIQQIKNFKRGSYTTYPTSQQNIRPTFGTSPTTSVSYPTTRRKVAVSTSNYYGYNVSTQISSSNSFLQAALMGDPHFYGFEGESFFFNGEVGKYYNLFSDERIQINSLFRYWETSGSQNFTAMEEIGITIKIPKIKIPKIKNAKLFNKRSKSIKITASGDVVMNGENICESLDPIEFVDDLKDYFTDEEIEKLKRTEGFMELVKAYVIHFWPYCFIVIKSTDHVNPPCLNIIARLDGSAASRPHGILGQTADFDGKPKEKIDGEECDYKVSDLWASDFKFNKFRR